MQMIENKKLKGGEIFTEISSNMREILQKEPHPLKELIKELKNRAIFPESIFKNSNKFYQNYIHDDKIFSLPLTEDNKKLLHKDFGISWGYDEKTKNPYRSYYILWDSCKKNKKVWDQKQREYLRRKYGVLKVRNKDDIKIWYHLLFGTASKWIGIPHERILKRILNGEQLTFGKETIKGVETYLVYSKINGKWVGLGLEDKMLHNLKKKVF